MTVAELRAILATLPNDLPVLTSGYEWGFEAPSIYRSDAIAVFVNPPGYTGTHTLAGDTYGDVQPGTSSALLIVRRSSPPLDTDAPVEHLS